MLQSYQTFALNDMTEQKALQIRTRQETVTRCTAAN
jgi:hypothetical protein